MQMGISYHMGWFCYAITGRFGVIAATGRIETGTPGDRLSLEPYHVAGGWEGLERVPVPGEPAALVKRGLQLQRRITAKNLKKHPLFSGLKKASILVGRGRRPPTLDKALAAHAQIHIAESFAVLDAITDALSAEGVKVIQQDRKSLMTDAERSLGKSEEDILAELKVMKPDDGPWRKEEQLCALATWLQV